MKNLEQPNEDKQIEQINWLKLNESEIIINIKQILSEVDILIPEMILKSDREISKILEDHLISKGFPCEKDEVSITVLDKYSHGHRIVKGMVFLPGTKEVINFEL